MARRGPPLTRRFRLQVEKHAAVPTRENISEPKTNF